MEKLLKQLITELSGFRKETNERFDRIETWQETANERFARLEEGQEATNERLVSLKEGQKATNARLNSLEEGQEAANAHFDRIEKWQESANSRFDQLDDGLEELKGIIRHNTTLMTENFTDIRKDMRITNQDTRSDIDLLFKEVEVIKRKTNKIEQSIKK